MRRRWMEVLCTLVGLISGLCASTAFVEVETPITPVEARYGWAETATPAEEAPQFALSGAVESSEGAVVHLWDYSKAINGREHFPTFRQAIGDCVANGLANGLNYCQAADIYLSRGPPTSFRPVDRPWLYGVSRTDPKIGNGRLGSSDGSVGAWAVKAAQLRGVLAADEPGVPEYSGARAREWGIKGVPSQFHLLAFQQKLKTYAQVRTYEDVRDALANSYPVTIASNVGFQMKAVVKDGKHWGRPSGSWAHQMCLIGVDDTAVSPFDGKKGAAYCLNSWGPEAHGKPADDAPPGGFWIDRTTVERIVKQGDSWAISGFTGFPARPKPDDFIVFDSNADVGLHAQDPVCSQAACAVVGVEQDTACNCALTGGCVSLLLGVHCLRRRLRQNVRSKLTNSA